MRVVARVLVITVTDSTTGTPLTYTNTMAMTVTVASTGPANGTPRSRPAAPACSRTNAIRSNLDGFANTREHARSALPN